MAYVTHTVYISGTKELLEITSEEETRLDQLFEEYPHGYFLGNESKQWVLDNLENFIIVEGRMEHSKGVYEKAVAFRDKADAARFKITWA